MSRKERSGSRSRYWGLLPLAAAIVCVIVGSLIPPHIGNWLVVGGLVVAVGFFGPLLRASGGVPFFPFGRRGPASMTRHDRPDRYSAPR